MTTMNLTVIGGGSVNWMRGLMRDVYLIDDIDGGEIRLVDPNLEHAEAVAAMLRVFNKARGKDYSITVTDDRKSALKDADFVMTTFSPGTMDAYFNDLEIPIKYGIRMPVSMTVGPSGISSALRTAPVAYEIVQDMEEACPGAWILNVTNPMTTVTRAMNMAADKVHVAGMCHELHKLPKLLGPILGLEKPEDVSVLDYIYKWLPEQGFEFTSAGLNHYIWLTKATLKGEDMIPRIREYAATHADLRPEGDKSFACDPWSNHSEATFALIRAYGYMPVVGDRHLVEFWPGLCNVRNGYAMKYGIQKTTVDHRKHKVEQFLATVNRIANGEEKVDWTASNEEMTVSMRAIINKKSVRVNLNLPNSGQISNLPSDVVVETFANINHEGAEPIPSGDLPGAVGTMCRLHSEVQELTLQSALNGDRSMLVEALSLDPLSGCADFSELGDMADELLLANKEWLPRFFR
jgi:galacturan 1,4-alpha-galacturonidase